MLARTGWRMFESGIHVRNFRTLAGAFNWLEKHPTPLPVVLDQVVCGAVIESIPVFCAPPQEEWN